METNSNNSNSNHLLQGMMDIIDIDGDDLLQALSDHEDLIDFHDDDDGGNNCDDPCNNSSGGINMSRSQGSGSNNNRGGGNNNNGGNNGGGANCAMIGTTIKAPLAPLEPLHGQPRQHQSRGRTQRAPRRKARNRSNSTDSHMHMMFDPQPLFGGGRSNAGGGRSVQSDDNNFEGEFGDRSNMFSNNNVGTSDVASACSAPADLFELGGFYNDDNNQGGGKNNDVDGNYDPTAIPDVMLIMRGLLSEGNDTNIIDSNFGEFQPVQIQRNQVGQGTRPRRRNTVDEGALANSLDSNNEEELRTSQESGNGSGGVGRGMRRRKTLDDPLSIMMSTMGDSSMPNMEQLQMNFDGGGDNMMFGMVGNNNQQMQQDVQQGAPLKRRKSEPMMTSFWDDEDSNDDDDDDDDMPTENNMGGGNNNHVGMSLNNMNMGVGNHQQVNNAQNMMSNAFIAAAKEAFESINRLKELMNGAGGNPAMMGGMAGGGQGQQQQQRQRQPQGRWQQQGQQRQMQRSQGQQQMRQLQRQGSGPNRGQQVQSKDIPDEFQERTPSSSSHSYRRKKSSGSISSDPMDMFMGSQDGSSPPSSPTQAHAQLASATKSSGKKVSSGKSSGTKNVKRSKSKEPITDLLPTPAVVPKIPLPKKEDPELLKMDQGEVMAKLQSAMDRTTNTQKLLQEWDRASGLPKSHAQTMVNSSRSRKQLTDGVILKKWNGAPLLNFAKEGGDVTKQTQPVSPQSIHHQVHVATSARQQLQRRVSGSTSPTTARSNVPSRGVSPTHLSNVPRVKSMDAISTLSVNNNGNIMSVEEDRCCNMAAFLSGSRGTLTNGLEQSRTQLKMYAAAYSERTSF